MTTAPEPWTPNSAAYGREAVTTTSLTVPADCSALFPEKPALPNGLAIARRIRFPVPATGAAALQARQVARPALKLILGVDDQAERLSRRIETCLAELVALAYTITTGDDLLCCVWTDRDHVFLAVEHDEALPSVPSDTTMGLTIVKAIADDYGTHRTDSGYQTWAAVVRA